MPGRCTLCCALVILSHAVCHADWPFDRFMISAWGEPADEAMAKAYSDAGFNTVMAKAERLDLCAKHGLRSIVMDATPEMVRRLKGHPGVWGWYVQDEPKAEEFAKVGERVAAFHAADPDRPAYVNLMAWMDLDQYLTTVKPRFLSYDYYQWWWGTQHYCWRLEAHRAAALKAGLPLVCWIEANADQRWEWGKAGATTLTDNAAKLRQSVWLAAAYGVRGIQWFNHGLIFDKKAQLTQSGRDIATINHSLRAMGPTLLSLKSEAVYHTAPIPPHATGVPEDLWVQSPYRNLSFGLFRGPDERRYLIVVNRDIAHDRTVTLRFRLPARVERFDPGTARWRPGDMRKIAPRMAAAPLSLACGGAAMLRLNQAWLETRLGGTPGPPGPP